MIKYDLRAYNHDDFVGILDMLRGSDVSFTNLEGPVKTNLGGWPTKKQLAHAFDPRVLDALKWMGFNLLSLANNHAFDLGSLGVLSTIESARKLGFTFAGTGANLEEAGAPCYLETTKGRVALIAMASGSLPENAFATSKCDALPARPGINPQMLEVCHVVKKKDLDMLKQLSKTIGYEGMKVARIAVGWQKPDVDTFDFYGEKFVEGEEYEEHRMLSEADLARNLNNIKQATEFADFVVVYMHQHHWDSDWQKTPTWLQDFAHKCIDAGATAFVGHGVPMLHGIEIYKKRPIFYSLGNFIFHIEHQSHYRDPRIWQSVVALSSFVDEELQSMRLCPVVLGGEMALLEEDYKHRTVPLLVHGQYAKSILERMVELSRPFGTEIKIVDDQAEIKLS